MISLPRVPSIFDDDFDKPASVGAPPPLGRGTGFLLVVTDSNVVGKSGRKTELGRSVLLIKEKRGGLWGPPGGMTDKTDHSPLHSATREFSEEVGADWRSLANKASQLVFLRLRPELRQPPRADETWCLYTSLSAQDAEAALFPDNRSNWTLTNRMNYAGSKDAAGYAFVPVSALEKADKKTGEFRLGVHTAKLRDVRRTLEALTRLP
jgi:ADP-ribose pyrophosphatase YjhB (NUDIX family)